MGDTVVTLSEQRRRQRFFPSVPEGGAAIIDFKKAHLLILRLRHLEEYAHCLLQLEVECVRLMHDRRCGFVVSVEPSLRAARTFRQETLAAMRFFVRIGGKEDMFKRLGAMSYAAQELCSLLGGLRFIPMYYTQGMGDVFNGVERGLKESRQNLEHLFPEGVPPLPPAAYML